jgi:TATA-binding protein-associated factor Taf7
VLFDLPCVTETYKMVSKSRLFKSGDIGQMLVVIRFTLLLLPDFLCVKVYDPNDEEVCVRRCLARYNTNFDFCSQDAAFFKQQRHDPFSNTLLSG